MNSGAETDLPQRLHAALADAIRARDRELVAAIRTVLGELANAEAVESSPPPSTGSRYVAGSISGVAAGEVPRRRVEAVEQRQILVAEIAEIRSAAMLRSEAGVDEEANQLRRVAETLGRFLDP